MHIYDIPRKIMYARIALVCTLLPASANLIDIIMHWSLFSRHQLTPISRPQTAPSGMPHLTCGTSFLLLFVFVISSIHHHPALLHRHTLILDRLLTFFVAFSTLVLKLPFSQSLSLHSHLSLPRADLLEQELWPLVFGMLLAVAVLAMRQIKPARWLLGAL